MFIIAFPDVILEEILILHAFDYKSSILVSHAQHHQQDWQLLEDRNHLSPALYKLRTGSNAMSSTKPSVMTCPKQKVITLQYSAEWSTCTTLWPQDFSTFSVLYVFQALEELKGALSHQTAGIHILDNQD